MSQIELMRPRVVATLGSDARRFVAAMAPELAGWATSRSLGRRRYRDLTGLQAEVALLRDALG